MSVINKMLRDLDSRQPTRSANPGVGEPKDSKQTVAAALTAGTVTVPGPRGNTVPVWRRIGTGWRVGSAVIVLGLVFGALAFWRSGLSPTGDAAINASAQQKLSQLAPVLMPAPSLASVPASAPASAIAPAVTAATPVVSAPATPSVPSRIAATVASAGHRRDIAASRAPSLTAGVREPDMLVLKAQSELLRVPLTRAPSSSKAAARAPRQGISDVVAQAQALWSDGARGAAVDLLQDAVARLELTTANEVSGSPALATLAREYARMTLAQGQPGEALAMLERLEPKLAGVADVWAVRGNAAQRLGRHLEAARAYERALALRPDEPRWMLGAAVSLAASGQTAPAAVLAEKARSAGALRPDVAAYLRGLGVLLRPD